MQTSTVENFLRVKDLSGLKFSVRLLDVPTETMVTLDQLVYYFKIGILAPSQDAETSFIGSSYAAVANQYYVRVLVTFNVSHRPTILKIFISNSETHNNEFCQITTMYKNGQAYDFSEKIISVSYVESFNVNAEW